MAECGNVVVGVRAPVFGGDVHSGMRILSTAGHFGHRVELSAGALYVGQQSSKVAAVLSQVRTVLVQEREEARNQLRKEAGRK